MGLILTRSSSCLEKPQIFPHDDTTRYTPRVHPRACLVFTGGGKEKEREGGRNGGSMSYLKLTTYVVPLPSLLPGINAGAAFRKSVGCYRQNDCCLGLGVPATLTHSRSRFVPTEYSLSILSVLVHRVICGMHFTCTVYAISQEVYFAFT